MPENSDTPLSRPVKSAAAAEVERFSREEAQGAQPSATISQPALVELESRDGKPVLRYFVSYSHKDAGLKEDLLSRLETRFDLSTEFVFEGWEDGEILPGERWRDEIERAIERCHFGLLLVSHEFLASRFITREELPRFVPRDPGRTVGWRRAVPVGLRRVPFDGTIDLKGLQDSQIFRHGDRVYAPLRADHTKDAFADELFQRILAVARKHIAAPTTGADAEAGTQARPATEVRPEPRLRRDKRSMLAREQREYLWQLDDPDSMVPAEGLRTQLSKELEQGVGGERVNAMEFLVSWLRQPSAPPFCALLGEYGMGKTTTCKALTLRLLDERDKDPALPLPIYLDLRHLGGSDAANATLPEILATVIRWSWQGGRESQALEPADLISLVQEEGALAIFDGLDEVLVHLDTAQGQRFTRELWRILPPAVFRRGRSGEAEKDKRPGRLLISCRTHYFRSLRDQTTHLTGEDREGISGAEYQALLLLPFTEEQIREYLRRNLPGQDLDGLLELIHSVHNLTELAERPYTLSLITRHIPQIEQWRLDGRRVSGVTLYRHMVLSWLERDGGKHQLVPDHKQRLMERLAVELWRSQRRSLPVAELEQWLVDYLVDNPRFAAHYQNKDLDLLKEDLRTATFLVRQGESDFRFAHTSLQEFFLASALYRALIEGRLEEWAIAIPSPETLHFLGQLLEEQETETGLVGLRKLRDEYRTKASELAFEYCLHAVSRGLPAPPLRGFRLEGADLRDWKIAGGGGGEMLDLRSAVFEGARLEGAAFEGVDLSGAVLDGARLERAELINGRALAADFRDAALAGCVFRRMDLGEAHFDGGDFHRTQLLLCRLGGVEGLGCQDAGLLFAECEPAAEFPTSGPSTEWEPPTFAAVIAGHGGPIGACAFSPDGDRILSASYDRTLRLWDVRSGEVLLALEGHSSAVTACVFSPDGHQILSGSDDRTLRLWDARSGKMLLTLEVHSLAITACAFSPDGQRFLSASHDHILRLRNARFGEPLLTLEGHSKAVTACAFSPDGHRIVSASSDQTLRLWNARSGEVLLTLKGHSNAVTACAFSPDGHRILSASSDQTLRLWDARSGEVLLTLKGLSDTVTACAFSPDGHRILSASDDLSLQLWDAESGEMLLTLQGDLNWVSSCAFSPDGHRAVSASYDQDLRLWDVRSGEMLLALERLSDAVTACTFSPDGQRILSAGYDHALRLWDAESGEMLLALERHSRAVTACAFSPDGQRILSASYDKTLRLWDARSGQPLLTLQGHSNAITACAFSPDGQQILSASHDKTLRLWNAQSGEVLIALKGHSNAVSACAFSPDGQRILSASNDRTLRLWDARSGQPLLTLQGHSNAIAACAFSPDGQRILSASYDQTLRLWDARSGQPLLTLKGHSDAVSACAFSPDGQKIFSASYDRTVRLWDTRSGRETAFRAYHLPDGEAAVLAPDGSAILWATPGAWRWLGWIAPDRETGALTRYPAEIYGPLREPRGTKPPGKAADRSARR